MSKLSSAVAAAYRAIPRAVERMVPQRTLLELNALTIQRLEWRTQVSKESLAKAKQAMAAMPAIIPTMAVARVSADWRGQIREVAGREVPLEHVNAILLQIEGYLARMKQVGDGVSWQGLVETVRFVVVAHVKFVGVDPAIIVAAWDAMTAIKGRHYSDATKTWESKIEATAQEVNKIEKMIPVSGAQLLAMLRSELMDTTNMMDGWTQKQLDAAIEGMREQMQAMETAA